MPSNQSLHTPSSRTLRLWSWALFGLAPLVAVIAPAYLIWTLHAAEGKSGLASPATVPAGPARPELALPRSEHFDYNPPLPGTYSLPVLKPAADGQVLTTTGQPARLRELVRGRISIVSFIYLRCASPKACPYATGVLRQLHVLSEQDPLIAENMRLITMSFDPAHDTPERMAQYAGLFQTKTPSAEWLFLTTASASDLTPILRAYGQTVDRKRNADDPLGPFYHPVRVFLIDRQGRIRNIYSFAMLDPRLIITDVRTLLLEEQQAKLAGR